MSNDFFINKLKHQYTNDIYSKRVAVLGPFPPPLGGVSVHIQRVIVKLKRQLNYVVHFDTCREFRYRFFYFYLICLVHFLLKNRPNELHLHTLYLSNSLQELRLILFLKKMLGFNIVLIEHNCRHLYKRPKRWGKKLNNMMPYIKKHIYIGSRTAQSYQQNNIMPAQATTIESAFLPPDQKREEGILATYPKSLFSFIARHERVILGNASLLSLIEGKDLYGFDQCIKALYALRKWHFDVGLVFVLGQVGNFTYFEKCKRLIQKYQLEHNVYILTGQKELWPLIKKVDVFVRPTLSDGASVSIEEALWCKKTVVASDVCWRPKDVVLYKTGDVDDLILVLSDLLYV